MHPGIAFVLGGLALATAGAPLFVVAILVGLGLLFEVSIFGAAGTATSPTEE